MQTTDKQRGDYRNNNAWSTVSRNKRRKPKTKQESEQKPWERSRSNIRGGSRRRTREYTEEPAITQRISKPKIEPRVPRTDIKPKPISSIGNYANIITKPEQDTESITPYEHADDTQVRSVVPILLQSHRRKKTVRNNVPRPNNNVSYDVWEHAYFQHILDLCEIFNNGARKLGLETDTICFLDIFAHFIRDCSSGENSPYIENLNPDTSNFYLNFTILRNNL